MMPLIRRFERVLRYVAVGGAVTLFYTLLVAVLVTGRVVGDPVAASVLASLVTLPISFLVHRRFTYADTAPAAGQWERFLVIAASNFAINVGLMKGAEMWRWPYWTALVLGWMVVPAVNYVINAVWVFRTKSLLSMQRGDGAG